MMLHGMRIILGTIFCTIIICLVSLTVGHPDDIRCYEDICVREDAKIPTVWFTDRPEMVACTEPYATCDIGKLVYEYCHNILGYSDSDRALCSRKLWRMFATKEQLIIWQDFDASKPVNALGFTRTNDWFEQTVYLPAVLSNHLLPELGDEFLFARPLHILEVGSFEGGSAVFYIRYLLSHPNSTLTCLDPWSAEIRMDLNSSKVFDTFSANIALTGAAPGKVKVFRNDSILTLSSLLIQGAVYDHIYIDGSHRLDDVLMDMGLSWRMLAPGGVMTIDDVPWRGKDPEIYAQQVYSQVLYGDASESEYPYCYRIGQREYYKLEDSISAMISNFPNADVIHCGYHIALKKRR